MRNSIHHCKHLITYLVIAMTITSEALSAQDANSSQDNPQATEVALNLNATLSKQLNDSIDKPEEFFRVLSENEAVIKQQMLPHEINTINLQFLKSLVTRESENFDEMRGIFKKWIDVYSKSFGRESLLTSNILIEIAIDVKNQWYKNDPHKTILFNRDIIDLCQGLDVENSTKLYPKTVQWIASQSVGITSQVALQPHEKAKPLFEDMKSLVEIVMKDENISITARSKIAALFANYIYAWGYPQSAKEYLDKYLKASNLSDLHPDALRVYYYINLSGLANREEAYKYLKAVENYDFTKISDSQRPRLFEMMSNAYYLKMGLSQDQLTRDAAGFVWKQREINNNIGSYLL